MPGVVGIKKIGQEWGLFLCYVKGESESLADMDKAKEMLENTKKLEHFNNIQVYTAGL